MAAWALQLPLPPQILRSAKRRDPDHGSEHADEGVGVKVKQVVRSVPKPKTLCSLQSGRHAAGVLLARSAQAVGFRIPAALAAVCLAGAGAAATGNPASYSVPVSCDRGCLKVLLDQTLDAMAANDISQLPLASDVKATENGVERALWDGLWRTANARGRYRITVVDAEAGQAGFVGTMMEDGRPVYIALRIAVREQKIGEIETVVARGGTAGPSVASPGAKIEEIGRPRPQFQRNVAERERMSREELVRVADAYFANLQGSTGKTSAPFAKGCERIENGGQTTNLKTVRPGRERFDALILGCEGQQLSGFYAFVTGIRNRRYPIVDRERQLVLSFSYWDHTGAVKNLVLTNGLTVPSPFRAPLTFQVAELFQIDAGKHDQIEAVINTVPYGMRSDVWDK
ncbi:hypothetical protein M2333_001602 [Sphingobium sp. B11D3B]|uniref:hypothetical protein n=1 Tax=unclassified Sphingobium TaxID=2611147 RepID=UPI002224BA3E|nr:MULTISPECIES: hypothetical protein [unclassified Sphingobium]MCW2365845.1 hypothetical protein [Sphingobium sp. B7D2B]MCW2388556.1 hypothetical protein [Sphingobium sp. B11D3B]